MDYTFYSFLWYFFIYAVLGWCLEIVYAAFKEKHFLNRGVLNGPLCPVYGLGMILILFFFGDAKENFIFLIIGCSVVATIVEYFTGALMERMFKKRWWDYSSYKYNLNGHVCLPFSLLWGLIAACSLKVIHPFIALIVGRVPPLAGKVFLIAVLVIFVVDLISVFGIIFEVQKYNPRVEEFAEDIQQISNRLGRAIFTRIQKRMTHAHPILTAHESEISKEQTTSTVFAPGCCFYKLVWLFFISAFLGDITETIFCYVTAGKLMSRSSVVYGPFSIVWGLGVVVLTMMLHRYRDRDDRYIFIFGTVVGGAYEYICSVFTEIAFGTVFWDYSKLPFNLGGRINLLYCFFWGLAAVVWIKIIYPFLSGLIEKIPKKTGKILSGCIIVFMIFNVTVSALALARYTERHEGREAKNQVETFLDDHFPDQRIDRIYPNLIMTE